MRISEASSSRNRIIKEIERAELIDETCLKKDRRCCKFPWPWLLNFLLLAIFITGGLCAVS